MDSRVDLGGVEALIEEEEVSGEGAMREVGAVLEVDAAAAATDVGATITIGMVVLEAVLEVVAAVVALEAVAVVVVVVAVAIEAVLRVENLGAETIDQGNRGATAGMAIGEASKAVLTRKNLSICLHLLKIKRSLLMINDR